MENIEQDNISLFELTIDHSTATHLRQIGKWARFVAVAMWSMLFVLAMFVFLFNSRIIELLKWYYATYVFGSEIYSSRFDSTAFKVGMSIMLIIVVLILAAYYMFFYFFGNNLIKASKNQDQQALERGFNWYKVFMIIATIFSGIGALFVVLTFLTRLK